MAELSRLLTLFPQEPLPAPRRNVRAPHAKQLWIAICPPEPAASTGAKTFESLLDSVRELTPFVCVETSGELLLEIQGSMKLFAGLEGIKRKLLEKLGEHERTFRLGISPTPLAALWLARHGGADVPDFGELAGRLSVLPIHVTRWPEEILVLLLEMGVRRIGDCLRLPRDGLARRVGKFYLRELDKALGREPDLRAGFEAQETLSWTIDFPLETEDRLVFEGAIRTIVADIVASLRRRQSQLRSIEVVFHQRRSETVSRVEFVEPVHEELRILGPLLTRLESVSITTAVTALELSTGPLLPMQIDATELVAAAGSAAGAPVSKAALIEVLRGRFGREDVYGIGLLAEHRPELVWTKLIEELQQRRLDRAHLSPWAHERPLWLLPSPLMLDRGISSLSYEGVLRKESEPERIETGWWDGRDIRRDYYTVATARGERLWVYQDCETHEWYLHGIFG